MRKVTRQAVNALLNFKDFRLGNTEIRVDDFDNVTRSRMYLHGHAIAEFYPDGRLYITNANWFTTTTKERLNGLPNVFITQKNFSWFLNGTYWDGQVVEIFKDGSWRKVDFTGMSAYNKYISA